MGNIFQIQQDLLAIFDMLEENGGELTPELEAQLAITEESFKDKVQSYANAIKLYKADLAAIKEETDRLKKLKERKEKTIDRLSKVILEAIEKFGDEKPKTKVKYIDYGTGQVSTRTTKSVQLYDDNIAHIMDCINFIVEMETTNNQLDVIDRINEEALIDIIASRPMGSANFGIDVSDDDLKHINLKLTTTFPLKSLLDGCSWDALKEVIKNDPSFKLESNITKSDLSTDLGINGSCAPHIGKLVTNTSLTIK